MSLTVKKVETSNQKPVTGNRVLLTFFIATSFLLFPHCSRHPYHYWFAPRPEPEIQRERGYEWHYYYQSSDPGEAILAAILFLPVWKKGMSCSGIVTDKEKNPVPDILVVFKRKDWMGQWKVSVIQPKPDGKFSFYIEPQCENWEISVLGDNIGSFESIIGGETSCPPLDFTVTLLDDPQEIRNYRERWLTPYVASLIALGPGAMSEEEKNILLSLLK